MDVEDSLNMESALLAVLSTSLLLSKLIPTPEDEALMPLQESSKMILALSRAQLDANNALLAQLQGQYQCPTLHEVMKTAQKAQSEGKTAIVAIMEDGHHGKVH